MPKSDTAPDALVVEPTPLALEPTTLVLLTDGYPGRVRGALITLPGDQAADLIAAGEAREATDLDRALAHPNFGG